MDILEGKNICQTTQHHMPEDSIIHDCFFILLTAKLGARGGTVGWGTVLQAGKSQVRFLMVSLDIFIDIILQAHYGPGVDSASDRNEYQEYFLGFKVAAA